MKYEKNMEILSVDIFYHRVWVCGFDGRGSIKDVFETII